MARGALELAEFQFKLKTAAPLSYDLDRQRSILAEVRADLAASAARLEKSQLKAPIDGLVTKINYQIGEQVLSGQPAIEMVGKNKFRARVNVAEADVAKLRVNQPAAITIDAFGRDQLFTGVVSFIESSPTLIQDVVYYRADVILDETVADIKVGLSADVMVETAVKVDVLYVPQRAVLTEEGIKRVRVLENGEIMKKEVVSGLRADGGFIEIITGLSAGEDIITFIRDN